MGKSEFLWANLFYSWTTGAGASRGPGALRPSPGSLVACPKWIWGRRGGPARAMERSEKSQGRAARPARGLARPAQGRQACVRCCVGMAAVGRAAAQTERAHSGPLKRVAWGARRRRIANRWSRFMPVSRMRFRRWARRESSQS